MVTNPTGNAFVDSILWGGARWPTNTLRYAFVDGGSTETTWTDDEKAAFRAATASWATVADLTFIEVDDPAEADWVEHITDTHGFELLGEGENALGMHDTPEHAADDPDGQAHGWFNREGYGWPDGGMGWAPEGLVPGGYGFETFVHEIGHALGLAHPHDTGGGSPLMPGVTAAFGDYGDRWLNQTVYTVMSYNRGLREQGPIGRGQVEVGYAAGPSQLDIAAIQYLYGARADVHAGDDTYHLTERGAWTAIWDTGGIDEIVYDGALDAVIRLFPAHSEPDEIWARGGLSYFLGHDGDFYAEGGFSMPGDFTSALVGDDGSTEVLIENASGGSGYDKITGNAASNVLYGNDGGDWLDGGSAGDNRLFGGAGGDHLAGGSGNDFLDGGPGRDDIQAGDGDDIRFGGPGKDSVHGHGGNDALNGGRHDDYMTGGPGDDRLAGQGGEDDLRGNGGDDRLDGGPGRDHLQGSRGDDWLIGGRGDDVLAGGWDSDTFEFTGNFGRDTIKRFEDDTDTLVLDDALWGGGLSKVRVLRKFGEELANKVVLDFGGGEKIIITGVDSLSDLRDDLVII